MHDRTDFQFILEAYHYRGYSKGSRAIYMHLSKTGNTMNRKKIQRLMNKYNLVCYIREANPYKRMQKATQSSTYAKNRAQRKWSNYVPGQMLETDITYMYYGSSRSKKAYLSTIKDACTKQILAYVLSDNLRENFVLQTIDQLMKNHSSQLRKSVIIHSDQGWQYQHSAYVNSLKAKASYRACLEKETA